MFATVNGKPVTDAEVADAVKRIPKAELDGAAIHATIEDFVEDALLAADARAQNFAAPEAKDDGALAEAYAKAKFSAEAAASVTDADLANWFAERRGMARVVFKDEEAAKKGRDNIVARIAGATETDKIMAAFLAEKGKRREAVPDGVLVDVQGLTETGERVIPEEGAKVLFTLEKDGDISPPTKVGDMWILVLRLGVRPGTPLASVPADQKDAAREKLVSKRANDKLEEHIARLRKDNGVKLDELAIRKYTRSLGVETVGKMRRLPFGQRRGVDKQRVPGRAPGRPHAPDVDRMLQERAKMRPKKDETTKDGGSNEGGPSGPGGTP